MFIIIISQVWNRLV